MDLIQYAASIAAVVALVAAVLWWRARRERERLAAIRRMHDAVDADEAFLDSSHISGPIPGIGGREDDPAARAAAAMRRGDRPAP